VKRGRIVIISICSVLALLGIGRIVWGELVLQPFFGLGNVNKENVTYDVMIGKLSGLQKTYNFHLEEMRGGNNYYVFFDHGIDHTCIIRADGATEIIGRLKSSKFKVGKAESVGMGSGYLNWCNTSGDMIKYSVDQWNYFVVNESSMTVWYVQYSS
jgi:hypothetical protein